MVLLAKWSSSMLCTSAFCRAHTVGYVYYCQPRKNVFMEEITLAKEKGKVIRQILSDTFYFSSTVSLKTGRLTKKSKWQTEWIVICVPRHLLIGAVSVIIKRSTMAGGKGTIAASATNHSPLIVVWRPTFLFTVARNCTNAIYASTKPLRLVISRNTLWSTLERSRTLATNAIIKPLWLILSSAT